MLPKPNNIPDDNSILKSGKVRNVGVAVGVLVGVAVGVLVGVAVGVLVDVAVGVLVGVSIFVYPGNAPSPMRLTVSGIFTHWRSEQPSNARSPMAPTPSEMFTD